jgi:hypothetical protein
MDAKEFDSNLGDVRDLFEPLLEAGVFTKDESTAREIACLLGAAALLSEEGKIPAAMTSMLTAEALINGKVGTKGRRWRIWNLHMLPLWVYHVVCCALIPFLALRFSCFEVLGIPAAGLLVGAFGAELRGLYWLQWQISARKFRPTSVVSHLTAPLIGALLGMLAYLVGELGILVLAQSSPSGEHSPNAKLASLALAFLSGFKWEWILERLEKTVFNKAN